MARRHSRAVFASHYVFPGGLLEPVDAEVHGRATGVTADEADAMIGVEAGGLDYYSAAIREAFEESSVLLARQANGQWAFNDGADQHEPIQSCRDQLNACELGWSDFLERNDFRPAYEALHYIAYWVTPRVQSKRFSTRFFLAEMPEGQSAVHDDGELTHSCWMTAAEILAAGERGDMKLMYPTMSTLRDIARYDSVESVIEWARERGKSGVARMLPAFVEIDGKDQVVLPGNPHYPADIDT
jgi:8-oxo-dGTP pyrophosphatase MutT (NUDIX family)